MEICARALDQRGVPFRMRKGTGDYRPHEDAVKIMTMKVSKGLEFPIVAIPGIGLLPTRGEDEKDEARLFYVAATRATEKLILSMSGDGAFAAKLGGVSRPA